MDVENTEETSQNTNKKANKKNYFDKQFKKHLIKSLSDNKGEPGNIKKIRGNRYLAKYPEEKVVQYLNDTAAEVQKDVEESLTDRAREVSHLATFLQSISNEGKSCDELKLVMKLNADALRKHKTPETDNVDFIALNKFLYSAVSGNPDISSLNEASIAVLNATLQQMNDEVDKDATPDLLKELTSQIFQKDTENSIEEISEAVKLFENFELNPFNIPLSYLLENKEADE